MTDLERFFRRLVANLAGTDPARLHRPLPLEDVHQSIVPYRSNRGALRLESSEDYESVLLRLCAGEGGFVRTEPEEARARFAEEAAASNPDLAALHRFEHVLLTLRAEPLARALGPRPELPELPELDELDALPEADPTSSAGPGASQCLFCGGVLPAERSVKFCPHCGQSQAPTTCPSCQSDVEAGWRHCVSCGRALGER